MHKNNENIINSSFNKVFNLHYNLDDKNIFQHDGSEIKQYNKTIFKKKVYIFLILIKIFPIIQDIGI